MTRKEVLEATAEIVCKDRDAQYGHPENNFELIAKMWSIWLDAEVTASDVAMMMAMLKIARIKTGKVKEDNYIDLIGYIACMTEIDTPAGTPTNTSTDKPTNASTKPKFDINDYEGKYAMHCNSEAEAETFCNYLDSQGKKWYAGDSYKKYSLWAIHECYEFNKGVIGKAELYKKWGYTILEFDNFDWKEWKDE